MLCLPFIYVDTRPILFYHYVVFHGAVPHFVCPLSREWTLGGAVFRDRAAGEDVSWPTGRVQAGGVITQVLHAGARPT